MITSVFLAPLVALHNASENDNAEMNEVMAVLDHIATETTCAVSVAHHVVKSSAKLKDDGAGDANLSRGAGAIGAAGRGASTLTRVDEADVKRLALPSHDIIQMRSSK